MRNVNYANTSYIKKRYLPFDNPTIIFVLQTISKPKSGQINRIDERFNERMNHRSSFQSKVTQNSHEQGVKACISINLSVSQNNPQHKTLAGNPMKHGKPVSQELKPCGRMTCASEIQTRNTGPEIFQNFTTSGEQLIVDSSLDLYIRFIH